MFVNIKHRKIFDQSRLYAPICLSSERYSDSGQYNLLHSLTSLFLVMGYIRLITLQLTYKYELHSTQLTNNFCSWFVTISDEASWYMVINKTRVPVPLVTPRRILGSIGFLWTWTFTKELPWPEYRACPFNFWKQRLRKWAIKGHFN